MRVEIVENEAREVGKHKLNLRQRAHRRVILNERRDKDSNSLQNGTYQVPGGAAPASSAQQGPV